MTTGATIWIVANVCSVLACAMLHRLYTIKLREAISAFNGTDYNEPFYELRRLAVVRCVNERIEQRVVIILGVGMIATAIVYDHHPEWYVPIGTALLSGMWVWKSIWSHREHVQLGVAIDEAEAKKAGC